MKNLIQNKLIELLKFNGFKEKDLKDYKRFMRDQEIIKIAHDPYDYKIPAYCIKTEYQSLTTDSFDNFLDYIEDFVYLVPIPNGKEELIEKLIGKGFIQNIKEIKDESLDVISLKKGNIRIFIHNDHEYVGIHYVRNSVLDDNLRVSSIKDHEKVFRGIDFLEKWHNYKKENENEI